MGCFTGIWPITDLRQWRYLPNPNPNLNPNPDPNPSPNPRRIHEQIGHEPFLLTWINFNPGMDK